MILVWMILLCVGLYFSLGQKVSPYLSVSLMTKSKYKTPTDYRDDVYATQGVILEGMTNENSKGTIDVVVGADYKVFKDCVVSEYDTSTYGYCSDNYTKKTDEAGSNCKSTDTETTPTETPMSCAASTYGCCPDNYTVKNADGSSCALVTYTATITPTYTSTPTSTPTSTSTSTPTSTSTAPIYTTSIPTPSYTQTSCAVSTYGCCPDNYTVKNADGSSCAAYPTPSTATPVTVLPSSVQTPLPIASNDTSTIFLTGPSRTALTCPEPQPCPPCGRCPEPSFDCKKVPNYSSTNSEYLPVPVLTDFSQFGM